MKLKSLLKENGLGDLPSSKLFKFNKETGKFEKPLNEGFGKPNFYPTKVAMHFKRAILAAYKDGSLRIPYMEEDEMIDYAKDISLEMVSKMSFKDAMYRILSVK